MSLTRPAFLGCAAAFLLFASIGADAQPTGLSCTLHWLDARIGTTGDRIDKYNSFILECRHDRRVPRAYEIIKQLEKKRLEKKGRRTQSSTKIRHPVPSPPAPVPPPPSPPTPSAAPLSMVVFLGGTGSDHARSFSEAMSRVAEGGEIRVLPGRYRETVRIDKSVTVIGHRNTRSEPVFDGLVVTGEVVVRLEMIGFEGVNESSTVRVEAGNVALIECVILNSEAPRLGARMTSALFAPSGRVQIEGGTIGPGGDAAIIVSGNTSLTVRGATVDGDTGYGLHASGQAHANVRDGTKIFGTVALEVTDRSTLILNNSTVTGSTAGPPISVSSRIAPDIVSNRVGILRDGHLADPPNGHWLRLAPGLSRDRIFENVSASGRPLENPRSGRRRANRQTGGNARFR